MLYQGGEEIEYSVSELAKLSGVSARTLRYYNQIGLLSPARTQENGYRVYGKEQVDRLQQILFYREIGFGLEDIAQLLDTPHFDRTLALESHLSALLEQKTRINALIHTVRQSIREAKGECGMTDKEKFEGFKTRLMQENEEKYGTETRALYGVDAVMASNEKLGSMTPEQWARQETLQQAILSLLGQAMADKDPAGETARRMCEQHREWLCLFWKEGSYSKQAHRGLGELYCSDERFTAYYDDVAGAGGAAFLRDALKIYTQ